MKKSLLALMLLASTFGQAAAGERTIKLSVPGMFCASCPYIVEKAISRVDGVVAVEAEIENKTATVTFDDTVATVEVIIEAIADVGYESSLIEDGSSS